MATDFTLKAHDTGPSFQVTLTSGGVPVDLTGATVSFIMAPKVSGAVKVNSGARIVNATSGVVAYDWLATDTDTPGNYLAEWQIVFSDGRKQTAPTLAYNTVDVVADLDGV